MFYLTPPTATAASAARGERALAACVACALLSPSGLRSPAPPCKVIIMIIMIEWK
jgi:hypothetical protein